MAWTPDEKMKELTALCKRRGFVYQASEIYGGINGFWDYGPLGTQLKNNLRDAWWRDMVMCPPLGPDGHPLQIVGLDSSIIQNPKVWESSGHVGGFNDPMVDCKETKGRYRADHVVVYKPKDGNGKWFAVLEGDEETLAKRLKKTAKGRPVEDFDTTLFTEVAADDYAKILGPDAKEVGTLMEPRQFNLMFPTYVGATASEDDKAYLRPETAQGIFINFKNVVSSSRVKVPFGIAQVGKAFRNEVTPRNFIYRSREFEQMEMEWFCHGDDAKMWLDFWMEQRKSWWLSLGLKEESLLFRQHEDDELSHYSKDGAGVHDIEFKFPFTDPGFGELEGIAHRSNYDLTQHHEKSSQKLDYFDDATQEKFLPHVIEPAAGLTRGVLAVLSDALTEDESRPSKMYMKFHPRLAPIKAAILPLVAKDGMPEVAEKLYMDLRVHHAVQMDVKQNIGKRYARQDEAGTPYCFTIDTQTLEDQTVTVRDRDEMGQERIPLDSVKAFLDEKLV